MLAGLAVKDLGAHRPAHRTAVAAGADRAGIRAEQMAEVADHVTLEGACDQPADGLDVPGRHLKVVSPGDREDPVQVLALCPDDVGAHDPQDDLGRPRHPVRELPRLPREDLASGLRRPGDQHDAGRGSIPTV
jgi:hypothetical protein